MWRSTSGRGRACLHSCPTQLAKRLSHASSCGLTDQLPNAQSGLSYPARCQGRRLTGKAPSTFSTSLPPNLQVMHTRFRPPCAAAITWCRRRIGRALFTRWRRHRFWRRGRSKTNLAAKNVLARLTRNSLERTRKTWSKPANALRLTEFRVYRWATLTRALTSISSTALRFEDSMCKKPMVHTHRAS
jgi:hypothetical protein